MKQALNYQGGLVNAYNQFIIDLKQDRDFIAFKNGANRLKDEGFSYGVVIVRTNKFIIEKIVK